MRRLALALALLAAFAIPAVATAAECPKTTLAAVEAEVMCPVCGTPLGLASEAPQANRERALIQRLIDRCKSKDEIKQVLVAEYGEDVLALPEAEGFDIAAYAVPAIAVALAALGVLAAVRRWRRDGGSGPRAAAAGGEPDGATTKRLDADLERYDL